MKSFYSPFFFFIFIACTNGQKNSNNQSDTLYSSTDRVNSYDKATIKIVTYALADGGFGYAIYIDDVQVIDQPSIPSLPGNRGFATLKQAQKAGEFVVSKIRKNKMPPTVTPQELDSLGVLE